MKKFLFLVVVCALSLSVVLTPSTQAQDTRSLTIMHTASLYNRIQEFTPFRQPLQGGAPRIAAAVNEIRANAENSLLFSAGSDIMGTSMFSQYGGVVSADVMSRIGYDASLASQIDIVAGGNFDAFQAYNAVAAYPLVNANMDLSNVPNANVLPYTILEVNDLRVGVFGLANEVGVTLVNFAGAVEMIDTNTAIEESLAYFEGEGVDIVVLLSSLGVARDAEVAQMYGGPSGIDVIVGNDLTGILLGEPEDFVTGAVPYGPYPLVYNEDAEPTVAVYSGRFGSYLGDLDLTFDEAGVLQSWDGGLIFLDENITPDPDMQAYVDSLAEGIVTDTIIIGEADEDLNGSFRDLPWQENSLANMYADAFLEFGSPYGAQIALVNNGAVWSSIPAGEISVADLQAVQPFFNWLIIMDLTGENIIAAIEHGVSDFGGENSGPFLAVAGITYTFDPTLEAGSRVTEVLFNGEPIDPEGVYVVAVNDFMANGGDGFVSLQAGTNVLNTGLGITDLLQQYITLHSPLTPPAVGRITVAE